MKPCPVCGWSIPEHMARAMPGGLVQTTRCPNDRCGANLVRRRIEIDAGFGAWERDAPPSR